MNAKTNMNELDKWWELQEKKQAKFVFPEPETVIKCSFCGELFNFWTGTPRRRPNFIDTIACSRCYEKLSRLCGSCNYENEKGEKICTNKCLTVGTRAKMKEHIHKERT